MHGEIMLIEKLEAENAELRQHCAELRQNMNRTDLQVQQLVELVEFYKEKFKKAEALLEELQRRYQPELEYARNSGRCGI